MSGTHAGIEDEGSLEQELQSQLLEHQAALEQVQEALQQGGQEAAELQQMADELSAGIQELEASLLEMKKSRLLEAVAAAQQAQQPGRVAEPPAATHSPAGFVLLPPPVQAAAATEVVTEPACGEATQGHGMAALYPIGAPCRFRGEDGRWYQGRMLRVEGDYAYVAYAMPTRPHMLHGCKVLASTLRQPRTAQPHATYEVGDVVYIQPQALQGLQQQQQQQQQQEQRHVHGTAAGQGSGEGMLWQSADVVEVDDMRSIAMLKLQDGRRVQLEYAAITSSAHAGCSDLDASSDGSEQQGNSDAGSQEDGGSSSGEGEQELEMEGHSGLGSSLDPLGHARLALAAGVHTGTRHFAAWEGHTRGIASKLMAKMGYKAGTGLGSSGQGLTAPVEVLLFADKSGLGASEGRRPAGHGDHKHLKRKRGKNKAGSKAHDAREAAREAAHQQEIENGAPGLFGFINKALGDSSEAAAAIRAVEHSLLRQDRVRTDERGGSGAQQAGQGGGRVPGRAAATQDIRARLMDIQKLIEGCQAKVAHFQAMLQRNASNVTLAPQIAARLKQAQAELAAAQAEQSRMSATVKKTDQQRKMLKF